MNDLLSLKLEAYHNCHHFINKMIQTIESILQSLEESRNNESKSSVGDKYETGRAMLQLEEEKHKTQLIEALAAKNILNAIKPERTGDQVETGSLVITNTGIYFIAIAVGKIKIADTIIYGVSIHSPIGQVLQHKKEGDQVIFYERKLIIQTIL